MLFAVVDIETTGGRPSHSRITEICAIVTDGQQVLKRFDRLLNPGIRIPSGITSLTGITNEMVQEAPVFADIAQELYHLLHDKVFVAHNVNFDYSFIHKEFSDLGIPFSVDKICSAKTARKAFPGYPSYSLGNICANLKIPIVNRHRAGGDADATVALFHKIWATLGEDAIAREIAGSSRKITLPPQIDTQDIAALPETPGVYFFLGAGKKTLYTGKAINIRKRVLQHFDTRRGKTSHQLEKITEITFEETGSELMALLVEAEAIQRLWPEWNVAGKVPQNKYAIVHYCTANGELRLQTVRRSRGSTEGIPFSRLSDARATLASIVSQYGICSSRAYSNKGCTDPDCYCSEKSVSRKNIHNSRILDAINSFQTSTSSFVILCDGKTPMEKGIVHMENGTVVGWGFIDASLPFPPVESVIKRVKNIAETSIIASSFLRRIISGELRGYSIVSLDNTPSIEDKRPILEDSFSHILSLETEELAPATSNAETELKTHTNKHKNQQRKQPIHITKTK